MDNSDFILQLMEVADKFGGIHNAHIHLNRAGSIRNWSDAHKSLEIKQNMIREESSKDELLRVGNRMFKYLRRMRREGQKKITAFIDIIDHPLVFESAVITRDELSDDFHRFELGAYFPYGYLPEYERLVDRADFIGCPLITDEFGGAIGIHIMLQDMLKLASAKGKPLHVHVDQNNVPNQFETFMLIEAVGLLRKTGEIGDLEIWAIHSISPSCYSDDTFSDLVHQLIEENIGIIVCPSAALGMRQNRQHMAPIHNSIARVHELVKAGVHVRVGADNINDIFSPITNGMMIDEIMLLAHACRIYDPIFLGKLLAGAK